MYISKFGLKIVILFIIFCLIGRFLFPYGDEPDIYARGDELINEAGFWNLYSYFPEYFNKVDYYYFFINFQKQSFTSLWHHIDNTFAKNFDINMLRYFITMFLFLPLFWIIIFRKRFIKLMTFLKFKQESADWNLKLDSLCLSLLYSGLIYYSGLFSIEQFTLILSLYIFLFWGNYLFISIFFAMIAFIDLGNSMVLLSFMLIAFYFHYIAVVKKKVKLVYISILCILALALILGTSFLTYIEFIPFLAQKSKNMILLEEFEGYRDKYPIILRPFITWMTSIFLTPSGIKVVLVYILFLIGIGNYVWKIIKVKSNDKIFKNNILLLSALTTILFFVFLFPNYANAKYYIFMVPFFMLSILQYFNREKVMLFLTMCNIILFLHLFLYNL